MTNDDINRYIHVEIMGNACWHTFGDVTTMTSDFQFPCEHCGEHFNKMFQMSDYCSDDEPRRLLDEVVAKIWGVTREGMLLRFELMKLLNKVGIRVDTQNEEIIALLATAEQIAIACVNAHKGATK